MSFIDYTVSDRTLTGLKGSVTRQLNSTNKSATAQNPNSLSLESDIKLLVTRWTKYENKFEEYISEREQDLNDETYKTLTDTFAEFENQYNDRLRQFREILVNLTGQPTAQVQDNRHNNIRVKMPELKLCEFKGDVEEFQTFWDKFQALVHRRTDLEKVVKMTYLMDCLKGPALATIAGYNESEEDYDDAIASLLNKYADRDKTRQTLVLQLFTLTNPKNNLKELEQFKAEYERILKSLKHYVSNLSSSNWLISIILQSKLPANVDLFIYQKYNTKYFSIEQISGGLADHIDYLTKLNKPISFSEEIFSPVSKTQIGSYVVGSGSSKIISSSEQKFNSNKCLLCNIDGHRAKKCDKFPDVKSRREKLINLGRCTRCLKEHNGRCRFNIKCFSCGKINHNELFCYKNFRTNNETNREDKVSAVIACTASCNSRMSTALPTAIVNLINNVSRNYVSARSLFDSGSQMSFITSKLVSKLKLKIVDTLSLSIQGFKSNSTVEKYPIVNLVVALGNRKKKVRLAVVDNLPSNFFTPGLEKVCNTLKNNKVKLTDSFSSDTVSDIEILIGSEYFSKFVGNLTNYGDITLLETPGGHMIFGEIPKQFYNNNDFKGANVMVCRIASNYISSDLTNLVEECVEPVSKLWELESVGIDTNEINFEDKIAYDSYLNTVKFENGKYWVRLPFRPNCGSLPNNYAQALGQLYSLRSNLSKNVDMLNCYNNIIEEQLTRKFIEIVPHARVTNETHYLPHHGVAKNSVTTPLRIVFNCSAKAAKHLSSLNDTLMTGPSMTEKLVDILVKFRMNKFAYLADIAKAFLNIGLQEQDRNKVRFLWFKEPNNINSEIVTYRFASVLFGATSSPFLLQATLDFHLRRSNSKYRELLLRSFYVDNFCGSTNSEVELLEIYEEANKQLSSANMPLRMWATNNINLKDKIESDFENYKVSKINNILGLNWNVETDEISLKPINLPIPVILTKRKLLGLVSKVYDPMGLTTPVLIKGKLLVQSAWKSNVSWNDPLPVEFVEQWKLLREDFLMLSNIKFSRFVAVEGKEYNLHVFCDSSTIAYGCVLYLTDENSSNLLYGKAKVAPLKSKSLPQLELTAVWLGVKLAKYILSTLSNVIFKEIVIWSDSEACLQWIRNNKSNIVFVKNRVAEIKEIALNYKFYHVISQENPADCLSRGMKYSNFKNSRLWFSGPEWLVNSDNWPKQKDIIMVNEIICEPSPIKLELNSIFELERYSNLTRIFNITFNIFKFIKLVKSGLKFPEVSVYWMMYSQLKYFREIYLHLHFQVKSDCKFDFNCFDCYLLEQVSINKDFKFMIRDLGLYLDVSSGLIRSRGRLHNSVLSFDAKHPILMSPKCHLTKLIVLKAHRYSMHGGVQDTLATVRRQIWIPKGRQLVKKLLASCTLCRKIEGRPCTYPGPPVLPSVRVTLNRPFERVGVDYSGAVILTNTADNLPLKVYIALFTCTATRAVFLSVAKDMSACTFLLIFRKFCATYSIPKCIISDNGTNFAASAKFLEEMYDNAEVSKFCSSNRIAWKFIAPRAPWMGGFYEIMIKMVKNCLRKVLYKKKISLTELETILVEVQARINNRPLTYVESDRSSLEILTPSHLLCGRRVELFPALTDDVISDPSYLTHRDLNNHFRHLSLILSKFSDVWNKEYLLSLREKHYGSCSPKNKTHLSVGQVVLIVSDVSRGDWPLGRITKLHTDNDNVVRSVELFTNNKTLVKTIEKLVPLEISESVDYEVNIDSHSNKNEVNSCESEPVISSKSTRPKRLASIKATDNRQLLIADGSL